MSITCPFCRACIREKVHYADLGGLFHMTRTLMALHDEAEAAGITAILGMGGTPGITNLLARAAVDKLERVDSIKVQLGCGDETPSTAPLVAPYSIRTILDEFTKQPQVFQDGTWHAQQPLTGQEELIFPATSGTRHRYLFAAFGVRHLSCLISRQGYTLCLVQNCLSQ